MDQNRIEFIYNKCLTNSANVEEQHEFMRLIRLPENKEIANAILLVSFYENQRNVNFNDISAEAMIEAILLSDKNLATPTADFKYGANIINPTPSYDRVIPTVHRVHFLKTTWFRYAAILLLIAGTTTFLYLNNQPQNEIAFKKPSVPQDIAPGGNKAVLTLADGSTITLDSAAIGNLATQGNTKVLKVDAGKLAYSAGPANGELLYNTISTPKGGQYQIVLPDGSKVWLNAASSIKFPAAFVNDRKVSITGEVYFEISSNAPAPFIVNDMNRNVEIQVLGTNFNVNSYSDEDSTKITLLEGSVKVVKGTFAGVLKPGQQAQVASGIRIVPGVNIDAVMAWKNGNFHFGNTTIQDLMKQLARWYDVDIIYQSKVPQREFGGEISREANLSQVLKILNESKVKSRLEGTKLIIE